MKTHVETLHAPETQEIDLLELYRALRLPRMIEEKMLLLLRQGKISKWFSGIGQEAISVGSTFALDSDDVILPMHRNLGVFTTRKVDLIRLFRQLLGRDGGFSKGRERSFHFGAPEYNIIGMISHLAAMLPVADGFALAFQLRQQKNIALAFTGDGASSEGDFHEAINLAAVWNLPVIFLIENNGYGLSTPTHEQYRCKHLADRAIGYGIRGLRIDGNDVLRVHDTIARVRQDIIDGAGPVLIEAETFRMRGHEEASGTKYVPNELFEKWQKKDPLTRFEKHLRKQGILDSTIIEEISENLRAEIEQALEQALASPNPTSTVEKELADVYAPAPKPTEVSGGTTHEIRFVDALSEGLRQKMRADESVVLMGQDIAEYGGVFKITQDFVEEFGRERVRNTPIIESGVVGAAMGLALAGFKPVVEMQFADFVTCAFNQIANNLAKTHYRWGSAVNVTIRMPAGGGMGAGPFHSQTPEAWFLHVPGLKVAYPATPADAKGLLLAAIDDPNPVLFFEHKGLYRSLKGDVPEEMHPLPFGRAKIRRSGRDATIITWGKGVHLALQAAEKLTAEGAEIEVIDLRTLAPWDEETVLASVERTSRALILHEANLTCGFGAEIAAVLSDRAFTNLDAPVMRVAALDTPVPFSPELEQHLYMPDDRLIPELRKLLAF